MKNSSPKFTSQRGFTLAEVMVAMMIFVIVVTAALLLYDRSNIVFKQSVEASDMQQSTRVAFDKLVGDIRLAGFDFDRDGMPMSALAVTWAPKTTYTIGNLIQPNPPNGHTYVCTSGGTSDTAQPIWTTGSNDAVSESGGSTVKWRESGTVQYQQPDEQIEYAGQRAITLRSNLDYETDVAHENGREQDPMLETSTFPVVTTGNDEIVTYALKSTKSTANTDTITFYADTDIPRDVNPGTKKKEKLVTITGVDLSGSNPPYTLMRYTIDNSGNPDSGTPIADNIRDMKLSYYKDTAGTDLIAAADLPLGNGQYDGAEPDEIIDERDLRAEVKSIQLELIGMNPQSDGKYLDTADTIAPNFRKYRLASMIVPRNLGRRGMREFNVDEPGSPVLESVCVGGCNAVYLTWSAPTGKSGDIDSYSILYDNDSCAGGFSYSEDAGKNLDGYAGRFIIPGQKWYFAVQAINKFGAATSNCIEATVVNKTKPLPPGGLVATGGGNAAYPALPNQIDLYFPAATQNDDSAKSASCSGGGVVDQKTMPTAEKRYYRIIRGYTLTFQAGDPGVETILTETSTKQPFLSGTMMKWTDSPPDNKTANCRNYYYRIQTVDYCARNAAMNVPVDTATGTSTIYPAYASNAIPGRAVEMSTKPDKPTLQLAGSSCSGGKCDLDLSWTPVSLDAGLTAPTIFVDEYRLRIYKKGGTGWSTTPDDVQTVSVSGVVGSKITVAGAANTFKLTGLLQAAEYRITLAAVDCLESEESIPLYFPCDFGTTSINVSMPENFGGDGSAASPWVIQPPTSIAVEATGNVSKFEAVVYEGAAQVGSVMVVNNPAGNKATFALPDTTDGTAALIRIMATDPTGKCSIYVDRYFIDQPPPPCTLRDINSDPTVLVFTKGSNTIPLTLKNVSATETLTLKKLIITWDVGKGETLANVTFPTSSGTTSVSTNCKLPTTIVDVPATATKVTPLMSNYGVTINYSLNGGKKLQDNPVLGICVVYQSSAGDLKQCAIAPNAGTCTVPTGANCQ